MRGVQRGRHLRGDRRGARRFERALLAQQVLQAAAVDQAHVDEEHAVDLAEVVHGDDMRVLQPRRHPALPPKAFLEARVRGQLPAQHLERDRPALNRVVAR